MVAFMHVGISDGCVCGDRRYTTHGVSEPLVRDVRGLVCAKVGRQRAEDQKPAVQSHRRDKEADGAVRRETSMIMHLFNYR